MSKVIFTEKENNRIKSSIRIVFYPIFFMMYMIFAAYFYFYFTEPYFNNGGELDPKLFADSLTYLNICRDISFTEDLSWMRNAGPCIELTLLDFNVGMITIFNVVILLFTTVLVSNTYKVGLYKFMFLIAINPLNFLSFFGPNKEVFCLASSMCLLAFFRNRAFSIFFAAMSFAFLTRVPMFAAFVIFAIPFLYISHFTDLRKGGLSTYLFGVSAVALVLTSIVAYFFSADLSEAILGDLGAAEVNSRSTLISLSLEGFSSVGLYLITYIVRLTLNFYSPLATIFSSDIELTGIYYAVGVTGSSILYMLMVPRIFIRWSSIAQSINTNERYLIVNFLFITTLMLCLSPVIQHRYFLFVYPAFALFLSSKHSHRRISDCH